MALGVAKMPVPSGSEQVFQGLRMMRLTNHAVEDEEHRRGDANLALRIAGRVVDGAIVNVRARGDVLLAVVRAVVRRGRSRELEAPQELRHFSPQVLEGGGRGGLVELEYPPQQLAIRYYISPPSAAPVSCHGSGKGALVQFLASSAFEGTFFPAKPSRERPSRRRAHW